MQARERETNGSAPDPGSQTERVVLALRERLLRGDFDPGQRLTELTLVPQLQASRTPVRLALERLAHEGLLEALPTTGFRVRVFTDADVRDAIEVRGVLEGTAARLAAERLSDVSELATLRSCCREAADLPPMTVDRFVRYLEVNETFHRELWRLAKSPVLTRALEAAVALPFAAPGALVFGDAESEHDPGPAVIAIEHHRAIVEAIENREGTRAESLAREHSRVARGNIERALREPRRVPGASFVRLPRQQST